MVALLWMCLCAHCAWAGSADTASPVYGRQYKKARFDGDIHKYLYTQIRYPDASREAEITGTVLVRFFVLENGRIANIAILHSVASDCDQEAQRVISKMPPWLPATYKGRPVRSVHTVPVVFLLE